MSQETALSRDRWAIARRLKNRAKKTRGISMKERVEAVREVEEKRNALRHTGGLRAHLLVFHASKPLSIPCDRNG